MAFDLVITNGVVVDGSGLAAQPADVGVRDGIITEIGDIDPGRAKVVDADGRTVTPGFIDPHTHYDPQLCWDRFGMPSLSHGVTTVMTGNCGVTMAPCRPADRTSVAQLFHQLEQVPMETLNDGVEWKWESFGEYLEVIGDGLGINVAAMVGHSPLRIYVMGQAAYERAATEDEIDAMREVLRLSILEGAIGFSTSRSTFGVTADGEPIPSRKSDDAELFAICDVLGELNAGLFQTDGGEGTKSFAHHVRTVAGPIAQRTGRPAFLGSTVHEWTAPTRWLEVVGALEDFHARGARVYGQTCPGPVYVTFTLERPLMFEDLDSWRRVFSLPTLQAKLDAFRDPSVRNAMQFDGVDDTSPCFFSRRWDLVSIANVRKEENRQHIGKSVSALAKESGKRVIDALLDLAVDEDLETEFLYPAANGDEEAVAQLLQSPEVIVGSSDAGAHVKTLCGAGDTSLLLSRWVRERGTFSLEKAVRLLTFDQALALGLTGRGLLREGYAADMVILDPSSVDYLPARSVRDLPGGAERLWRDPVGIDYVIVNGGVAVDHGETTGTASGQVLRSADFV